MTFDYSFRSGALRLFAFAACLGLSGVACEDASHEASRESSELPRYDQQAPRVEIGTIYWGTDLSPGEQREAAAPVIAQLERLIGMVHNRNLKDLPDMVHPDEGLYVDLKARRSRSEIEAAVQDPESYLNVYFLDTEALRRERPEDPDRISVREALHLTRTLKADLYMSSSGDFCEVRLSLEDAPSRSYFLNNPVFLQEDDQWYVHRLF